MSESGERIPQPSKMRRAAEATAWGVRGITIRLAAATIASGALAYIPAHFLNKQFREVVGFNDSENQKIRDRFDKLRQDKQRHGIDPQKGPQIGQRLKHWWERMTKEFDGNVVEWAKESEPILALRIQHVKLLEYVDWASYYGTMGLLFLIFLPRINRRISALTGNLRDSLLRKGLKESQQDIKSIQTRITNLEKQQKELQQLAVIVDGLMKSSRDDVSRLSPEQTQLLHAALMRIMSIVKALPPEVQSGLAGSDTFDAGNNND